MQINIDLDSLTESETKALVRSAFDLLREEAFIDVIVDAVDQPYLLEELIARLEDKL